MTYSKGALSRKSTWRGLNKPLGSLTFYLLALMVVLQKVVLQAMVFQHIGKNENYLHMNKRKKPHG
jgi:hypothetical protein